MELEQPFNPDGLPCTYNVSSGFLITPDPQYQTQQMAAGKSFTFPLRLYSNQTYKGKVKLSLSIQPADPGLTGSFDPGVVQLGRKGTSVLTLKTSASAKVQAYTLKVIGVDAAGESHSAPLVLTMEQVATPPSQTPTAESMKTELEASGRVTLYINFDFNKATIKPDGKPIIAQVIKLMKDNADLKLSINGYTDNVGTHDYNVKLSQARAAAVVAALVGAGISADRLSSVGFGDGGAIADNKTPEGRAKNRRVELVKQ
jgi:outer membrane protein OmpA-like peptidoglycan-associated protein